MQKDHPVLSNNERRARQQKIGQKCTCGYRIRGIYHEEGKHHTKGRVLKEN